MRRRIGNIARLTDSHYEFKLGDLRYDARPVDIGTSALTRRCDPNLVTVISAKSAELCSENWLEAKIESLQASGDDVWTMDFLQGLIISSLTPLPDPQSFQLPNSIQKLTTWHELWPGVHLPVQYSRTTLQILTGSRDQDGPYLLSEGRLAKVFRIYDDEKGAFMVPVKPAEHSGSSPFQPLLVAANFPQSLSVAVPSKLAAIPTREQPLRGKRVAVKELFALQGLRMALSNRAFYDVATPAQATAPAIMKLLDAGAVIVGSTKCSSMISREDPVEAVDFQAPFNPRGDGYQSPVGSSSGSAAAIASYTWLDFTIGSDTTGSSRRPAFVNGCFQLRLSHDALSLDGIRPCFSRFDAPAIFTRSIKDLQDVTDTWCTSPSALSLTACHKPTNLIYPLDFFPVSSTEQQAMIDEIVKDVADTYQLPIEKVSFKQLWHEKPPHEAERKSLEDYLQNVGRNTFVHDFCHVSDDFRSTYKLKHGREPFVNKVTRWRWDVGGRITLDERDDAMRRMEVYQRWLLQEVMRIATHTTLMILPIQDVEPNYRDTDPGPPFAQDVWDPLWLSPVLGAPEVTVPVGELPYHSRVTARTEQLPVAVSFMGPPGYDSMLVSVLAGAFARSARPLEVQVGRRMYG